MKRIETLEDFTVENKFNEDIEDNLFVNEGLKLNFNFIDKIYNFFRSKFKKEAWLHTANFLYKSGALRKTGITVHAFGLKTIKPNFKLFGRTSEVFEGIEGFEKYDLDFNSPLTETEIQALDEEAMGQDHPNQNIKHVNTKELTTKIKYCIAKRKTLMIWGASGIAKTTIIESYCKSVGKKCIVFTLSVRDPIDFLGLPSINKEKGTTEYNSPGIFPPSADTLEGKEEEKTKGGVLFFDELNLGASMVLKAAMRMLLDKRLDHYILPKNWTIFAAGNRIELEAPDATPLSAAVMNRMQHVNFVLKDEEWVDWARSDKAKDPDGEDLIDDEIIAFIKFGNTPGGKSSLHYLPDTGGEQAYAWASPRSWTEASEEYIFMKKEAREDGRTLTDGEIELALSGSVGVDMARAFIAFLNLIKTIDISKLKYVYTAPNKAPLPQKGKNGQYNPSEVYAIISAIVYSGGMDKKKLTVQQFNNCVDYCIRLGSGDFAAAFVKMITKINKHLLKEDEVLDALKKWSINYQDFAELE